MASIGNEIAESLSDAVGQHFWGAFLSGCELTYRLSNPSAGAWEILCVVMRLVEPEYRIAVAKAWRKENPEWKPTRGHQREQLAGWGITEVISYRSTRNPSHRDP